MTLDEREKEFQSALTEFRATGSKDAWDRMYYRVYDCCHNIAAKKLIGIKLDPEVFEDRLLDSVLYCMKRIREGANPEKLSSYAYLCVIGRFQSKKAQFEDRNVMYVNDIFPYIEAQQQENIDYGEETFARDEAEDRRQSEVPVSAQALFRRNEEEAE